MKNLLLIFSLLLSSSLFGQIGPDGTGTVNGYFIGPGVDLTFADLSNANLSNANLSGAILMGTDLSGADLSGAILDSAILRDALLTGTIWSNVVSQSDYDAVVAERDTAMELAETLQIQIDVQLVDLLTTLDSVQAERDAALAAQASAEAERDAKLTLDEVKDLRAGSTMIEVQNGQATLSMDIEKSSDLSSWATDRTATVNIPIEEGSDTQFFRFKMTDASTFITVTIGEDTIAGQSTGVFYFNGVEKAVLEFQKNTNYTFIQNDSSNATYSSVHHPLMFSTGAGGELNGNGHYMTGVVYKLDGVTVSMADYVSGFVAASDRRIEWTVPSDAPSTLYYWCHFHTGQGAAMTVTD